MPNPSCECIKSYTLEDKLWAIYCVIRDAITNPMELPTCECVKSFTENGKLDAIYCALLQFTTQSFSGNIDPDQINGITPFGIAAITGNPETDIPIQYNAGAVVGMEFGQVAAGVESIITITASQISDLTDAGRGLIVTLPTPGGMSVVTIDENNAGNVLGTVGVAEYIAGGPVFSGNVSPVADFNATNGLATAVS
jgi:hypothetical protein